jgi:putative hydrolase of the HAD superfamily
LSKPDIRIFNHILNEYSLNSEESLYIDDMEENVKSAESAGMHGLLTSGSPKILTELEEKLNISLGI